MTSRWIAKLTGNEQEASRAGTLRLGSSGDCLLACVESLFAVARDIRGHWWPRRIGTLLIVVDFIVLHYVTVAWKIGRATLGEVSCGYAGSNEII